MVTEQIFQDKGFPKHTRKWSTVIPEAPAMKEAGVWFHSWSSFLVSPRSRGHTQVVPHWWSNGGICSCGSRGRSIRRREIAAPSHGRARTWMDSDSAACRSGSKSHPCELNIMYHVSNNENYITNHVCYTVESLYCVYPRDSRKCPD